MATQNPVTMERSGASRPWRASPGRRLASLAPFGLALAIAVLARTYFGVGMGEPPDILGLPLGLVLEGIVLAWAALGALIIWTTGSRAAASLAMVFITLPSMLAIIFTPAVILILQNLP
jgi:hypothetical protein